MKPSFRKVYDSRGSRVVIENGESTPANDQYACVVIDQPAPQVLDIIEWVEKIPEYIARAEAERDCVGPYFIEGLKRLGDTIDIQVQVCGICQQPIDRYGICWHCIANGK